MNFGHMAGLGAGIVLAWACASPSAADECPPGALDCGCALGFCDDGLTCVDDVCVAQGDGTSGSTSPASSTDPPPSAGSSSDDTGVDDGGSSDTSSDDGSTTTADTFGEEPLYDALVDGVPSSFDIDPHAYVVSAMIVRGDESGGMGAELIVRFPPVGVGTYDCVLNDIGVAIYYTIDGPIGALEMSSRTTGDCTVTVERVDEVGGFVTGTFAGTVRFPGSEAFPPVAITGGRFHVPRTADE